MWSGRREWGIRLGEGVVRVWCVSVSLASLPAYFVTPPSQNCSFFNSKSVPLKLVFKNADPFGSNINVIYKV